MADPAASQKPEFQVPTYTISYASDGTLQFDPPQGSGELAIALSIHFPLQKTLEEKLRAAQLSFLRSQQLQMPAASQEILTAGPTATLIQPQTQGETSATRVEQVPQDDAQFHQFDSTTQESTTSSQPANQSNSKKRPRKSRAKAATQAKSSFSQNQHVWDLNSGETTQKRTRRTLAAEEAIQVAANRGNICDHHRATRTKCDPTKCPDNKIFRQSMLPPPSPPSDASIPSFLSSSSSCHRKECAAAGTPSHPPDLDHLAPGIRLVANQNAGPVTTVNRPEDARWRDNLGAVDASIFLTVFEASPPGYSLDSSSYQSFPHIPSPSKYNLDSGSYESFPPPPPQPRRYNLEIKADGDKKKQKEEPAAAYPGGMPEDDNGGDDNGGDGGGGGGFSGKHHGGKDSEENGDGGASGGTTGSGSNGSSWNDPFFGFSGENGWYSSMVAVFMLVWLAMPNGMRTSLARLQSLVMETPSSLAIAPLQEDAHLAVHDGPAGIPPQVPKGCVIGTSSSAASILLDAISNWSYFCLLSSAIL